MTVARYLFLPLLGIAQDSYSSLPVVLPWYRLLESKGGDATTYLLVDSGD